MEHLRFIAANIALVAAGICTAQVSALRFARLVRARHAIAVQVARRNGLRRALR